MTIASSISAVRLLALIVAVLLGVAGPLHAAQAAASGPLDGTTLKASFADQAGKKQGDDQLVFAKGLLELPGLRKAYAFEPAAYTSTKAKDGTITFKATLSSVEHGSLAVEGTISKGAVSGKRTWSKPNKTPIEHTFTGTAP